MPNHPVDAHVGSRVRLRRTLLGLSQQKLGRDLGLTFQQIQKYERGTNRIGASRLYELSEILDVPLSFFFDEMPRDSLSTSGGLADPEKAFEHQYMSKRETLELVRAYYKITDLEVRKRIFEVIKSIAHQQDQANQ
ncbi:helix-turn-helix transcriptional regulator [Sneathiella marina]|uniref:Helix-turn-helix transcriptional regulator n=1 Tax=Sneathiella marina TaxID=2950108 RepID=A0ABY4W226_9PROT|nr:helix-turn-helix transcriptional regulator [Sneathiella marina]USG61213.1 helix-turn-helix transcriptional regulator [Sneathiella marina]